MTSYPTNESGIIVLLKSKKYCYILLISFCKNQLDGHYFSGVVYINNSLHLARKYAQIFVCGYYLFGEANSFPRAKLEESCELRGTDNVQGQIVSIFLKPNGGYCGYYPSNIFRNM